MHYAPALEHLVGNTPLIKLQNASKETGCTILGKAEFRNPGQSVKDRAALFIIKDAIAKGMLRPGGVIVEGTAGNTGIGLAVVGASMGFKTVIVIPDTQSQEKKDALRLLGARLVEVPAVPYKNPNNYVRYSGRLAAEIAKTSPNGAIWANQFDNIANRQAHIETTGPEIWEQTEGKVDGFICAVGSGGTLSGVAAALQPKGVKIGLADPMGAALYSYYTEGVFKSEGGSISEGIGQGRVTANLEGFQPDFAYQISDHDALPIVFDLMQHEGLCLGGSSGINVAGAMRMARELGPGHTIVTILCDSGARYQSKLFNRTFLREKGLPVPDWLEETTSVVPIGYGLSVTQDTVWSTLSEELIGADNSLDQEVFKGGPRGSWKLFTGDKSDWTVEVTSSVAQSSSGSVEVRSIDREVQEDSRRITFAESDGDLSLVYMQSEYPTDLTDLNEAGGALVIEFRVVEKPTAPTILRMDCKYPCSGEVQFTKVLLDASVGEWTQKAIPTACFADAGLSLEQVNTAFVMATAGDLTVDITEIKLATAPAIRSIVSCADLVNDTELLN